MFFLVYNIVELLEKNVDMTLFVENVEFSANPTEVKYGKSGWVENLTK